MEQAQGGSRHLSFLTICPLMPHLGQLVRLQPLFQVINKLFTCTIDSAVSGTVHRWYLTCQSV